MLTPAEHGCWCCEHPRKEAITNFVYWLKGRSQEEKPLDTWAQAEVDELCAEHEVEVSAGLLKQENAS